MDVSVVLDLDLSQLRHLVRLGVQHQRAQQGGGKDVAGEPIRVPGMVPPAAGPGSASMPLRSNAVIGIAVVAIVAEKIVESVLDFGKKMLQGSKVLNSYFGAMGKMFSAAVDMLLLPFTPLLNLLLMGMMKFVAWLTKPNVMAAIAAGIEKMGDMGRTLIEWARNVAAFFNNSWNPSNWDWPELMSGTVRVLGHVFDWLATNIPNALKIAEKALHQGAMGVIRDNTPSWIGDPLTAVDNWMLRHQKAIQGYVHMFVPGGRTGLIQKGAAPAANWLYGGLQDMGHQLDTASRWNDKAGRATHRAIVKTVNLAVDVVTSDPGAAATQVVKILTGEALAEAMVSGRLPHWSPF